jgi:putative SOS response-associated peptidase YedK
MCGRASLASSPSELTEEFHLREVPSSYRPRYNLAPSQQIWAIVADAAGGRVMRQFRWGLVPFWANDVSIGNRMINARAESAAQKPAFASALARRRCLIPVDGFYEWRCEGRRKVPMRICLGSRGPFALAGLWEKWRPDGQPAIRSCAILTTTCNELVRPIHTRMPAIVPRCDHARWLDPAVPIDELRHLFAPYPGDDLVAYAVATLVNNPINDGPECVQPVGCAEDEVGPVQGELELSP